MHTTSNHWDLGTEFDRLSLLGLLFLLLNVWLQSNAERLLLSCRLVVSGLPTPHIVRTPWIHILLPDPSSPLLLSPCIPHFPPPQVFQAPSVPYPSGYTCVLESPRVMSFTWLLKLYPQLCTENLLTETQH